MRSGLESTSSRNYGAWVTSQQLGALRAVPRARDGAGHRDGVQHRQHAPAVRDPDAGDEAEHVAVRAGDARQAARLHAGALAAGSAGDLLRRQRHAADAAPDGAVRRALSESRPYRRSCRSCPRVGSTIRSCRAAAPITASSCTATAGGCASWRASRSFYAWGFGGQYIFVDPDPAAGRRDDLVNGGGRGAAAASPHDLRPRRAVGHCGITGRSGRSGGQLIND